MADVRPFRALHYDSAKVDPNDVTAPPYDVIDAAGRERLVERSDRNVVELDLPEAADGEDPYEHAASLLDAWKEDGALVQDEHRTIWALEQDYTDPDGDARTRRGFLARVRVTEYGPGLVRPHERTQPGPKEDRLRLTRATKHNLSPIFVLHSGDAWQHLAGATSGEPFCEVTDSDGTMHRAWPIEDSDVHEAIANLVEDSELLIADGHHRYETARVYAEEVGGEGEHRFVLMLLCSLSDPGLTVFPTHRLLTGLKDDTAKQLAIREALMRDFEIEEVSRDRLEPRAGAEGLQLGYMDSFHSQPFMLTLKDPGIAEAALPDKPGPYQRLDTAVLEAIVLEGALGMSEDDISHLRGLDYSKSFDDAFEAVESGRADAGFFMRATPVERVREVAETGESMPPKSTYFFPKVPTGLVFNLLE